MAISKNDGLGYGQQLVDVSGSRAFGVTYYNTTGKPIFVMAGADSFSSAGWITLVVNGIEVHRVPNASGTSYKPVALGVVPVNGSYQLMQGTSNGPINWRELR